MFCLVCKCGYTSEFPFYPEGKLKEMEEQLLHCHKLKL